MTTGPEAPVNSSTGIENVVREDSEPESKIYATARSPRRERRMMNSE